MIVNNCGMLNSQSISVRQKWKLWREHKEDQFKEIATSQSTMFNYFFNNNDIFKFIADDDYAIYKYLSLHTASFSSTFSIDSLMCS